MSLLKQFILELFEIQKGTALSETDAVLKTYSSLSSTHGKIHISKERRWTLDIRINIKSFLHLPNVISPLDAYFAAYATLLHEIEHYRITRKVYTQRNIDFGEFLTILDSIRMNWKQLLSGIIVSVLNIKKLQEISRKRYTVYQTELLCRANSLQAAFDAFYPFMTEEIRLAYQRYIAVANFCQTSIMIGYVGNDTPFDHFSHALHCARARIEITPSIVQVFPALQLLFDYYGKIRPIYNIYQERSNALKDSFSEELIGKLIIRLLLLDESDITDLLRSDSVFKSYIEHLTQQYITECLYFISHKKIANGYLCASVLDDNSAMAVKNIKRMDKLIKKYALNVSTGIVIPLF